MIYKLRWPPVYLALLICLCACSSQAQSTAIARSFPLLQTIDLNNDSQLFTVDSLDWNPASDTLAIGGHIETYIYSFQNNYLQSLRDEPGTNIIVSWSPDGQRLAGSAREMWLWDSQTGIIDISPRPSDSYTHYSGIFWHPAGQSILSTIVHWNTNTSSIEQWNLATDTLQPIHIKGVGNPSVLDQSNDQRYIAIFDNNSSQISVVETLSFQPIGIFGNRDTTPLSWDPINEQFAVGTKSGEITVRDTTTWTVDRLLPSRGNFGWQIKWNPQGTHLAAAGEDGVIIWNVSTQASSVVQNGFALTVEWAPDGKRLATAVEDKVYIWDITQLP